MPHVTPSGKVSIVSFGIQADKDTLATEFYKFKLEEFEHTPNPIRGDDTPEMGEAKLDKTLAEVLGYESVDVSGSGRFRAGNQGHLLCAYGLQPLSGGFQFWSGVNSIIAVTDDGGGPVNVDLLVTVGAFTALTAGQRYTGTEVAAALKAALDANTTLTQTYTVTWDSVNEKFTIAHAGATLSLHWTSCPMMANQLGYSHGADDTGATTYTSDEARDVTARHWFRDGDNEVLGQITDDGGGPVDVDVLAGTGAVATAGHPYSPWATCAVIKAVLDANTTLTQTYTVTYSVTTNKYTIAHAGATLTIAWTNAANTIGDDDLGFTADDAAATSYTADEARWRAAKHRFVPRDTAEDFPYYSIFDQVDTEGRLDLTFRGVRLSELTIEGESNANLKINWSGKALDWGEAAGGETVNAEQSSVAAPNTFDPTGHIKLGSSDFRIAASTATFAWEEQIEPQQCEGEPYNVEPVERSVEVVMDVYLGSRDDAEIYRKVYFGSGSGTAPDPTIVQEALDILYQSGTVVPGQTGSTERFAYRLECEEANLTLYPLGQSGGDLLHADLTAEITRESGDWAISLVNNMSFGDYGS